MKASKGKKELIKQLIEEYDIRNTADITNMIKDLMGNTIGEMLNSVYLSSQKCSTTSVEKWSTFILFTFVPI